MEEPEFKLNPIFIVGSPRSGTTLLRVILDSHSKIAIPDETGIFEFLYYAPGIPKIVDFSNPQSKEKFIQSFKSNKNFIKSFSQETINNIEKFLRSSDWFDPRMFIKKTFSVHAAEHKKYIWGDKTPRHAIFMKDILELFPEASIIYVVRDPRAVFASMKRYAKKYKKNRSFWMTDDPAKGALMWRDYLYATYKYKDKIFYLRYEDLISEPEKYLKIICNDVLKIKFEDKMLQFQNGARDRVYDRNYGKVPEWHNKLLEGISKKNIHIWEKELNIDEIRILQNLVKDELEKFNYKYIKTEKRKVDFLFYKKSKYKINRQLYVFKAKVKSFLDKHLGYGFY